MNKYKCDVCKQIKPGEPNNHVFAGKLYCPECETSEANKKMTSLAERLRAAWALPEKPMHDPGLTHAENNLAGLVEEQIYGRHQRLREAVEECVGHLVHVRDRLEEDGAYLVEDGFEEPEYCLRFRLISDALQKLEQAIKECEKRNHHRG